MYFNDRGKRISEIRSPHLVIEKNYMVHGTIKSYFTFYKRFLDKRTKSEFRKVSIADSI